MPKRNSEVIDARFVRVMKAGSLPYKANRMAVRALDIEGDVDKGDKALGTMLVSSKAFVKELEGVANVADEVVRRLSSALR